MIFWANSTLLSIIYLELSLLYLLVVSGLNLTIESYFIKIGVFGFFLSFCLFLSSSLKGCFTINSCLQTSWLRFTSAVSSFSNFWFSSKRVAIFSDNSFFCFFSSSRSCLSFLTLFELSIWFQVNMVSGLLKIYQQKECICLFNLFMCIQEIVLCEQ